VEADGAGDLAFRLRGLQLRVSAGLAPASPLSPPFRGSGHPVCAYSVVGGESSREVLLRQVISILLMSILSRFLARKRRGTPQDVLRMGCPLNGVCKVSRWSYETTGEEPERPNVLYTGGGTVPIHLSVASKHRTPRVIRGPPRCSGKACHGEAGRRGRSEGKPSGLGMPSRRDAAIASTSAKDSRAKRAGSSP